MANPKKKKNRNKANANSVKFQNYLKKDSDKQQAASNAASSKRNVSAANFSTDTEQSSTEMHESNRRRLDPNQSAVPPAVPGDAAPGAAATSTTSLPPNAVPPTAPGAAAPGVAAPGAAAPGAAEPSAAAPSVAETRAPAPGSRATGAAAPGFTAPGVTAPGNTTPAGAVPQPPIRTATGFNAEAFAQGIIAAFSREDVCTKLVHVFADVIQGYEREKETGKLEMNSLREEVTSLRSEVNELKQYSRRNSLRISNPQWREHPYENTDELVIQLAGELGLNFPHWLIDRSHRVGKHLPGRQRDILVKFIGYGPRNAMVMARNRMRANPRFRNIYINEDLSAETGLLYFQARSLKKEGRLNSASTRDGRVIVSRFTGDPAVVVKTKDDLDKIASRGTFANVANQGPSTESIADRLMRVAGMVPNQNAQRQQPARTGAPPPRYQTGGVPPTAPGAAAQSTAAPRTPAQAAAPGTPTQAATAQSAAPSATPEANNETMSVSQIPPPNSTSTPGRDIAENTAIPDENISGSFLSDTTYY